MLLIPCVGGGGNIGGGRGGGGGEGGGRGEGEGGGGGGTYEAGSAGVKQSSFNSHFPNDGRGST